MDIQTSLRDNTGFLLDIRLLLGVFLVIVSAGAFHLPFEWDEGSFLMNVQYFQGDEANFEPSRPAALPALTALTWQVTGESTFAARLLVAVSGAAAVYLFYRLSAREFDNPLPVTAVFAFAPLMLYWSSHVYTDIPGLVFVLGALYAYRNRKYLASGALISVAATFRYVYIVFAAGLFLAYLLENREGLVNYSIGGVAGALPLFLYSQVTYGTPWDKIVLYITNVSEWSGAGLFESTSANLVNAFWMLSVLIPATYTGWRETPVVEKTMLASYTAFVIFFSGMAFQRYWLPALPFLLLIGYRGLDRRAFAVVAGIMLAVSGYGVVSTYTMTDVCEQPFMDSLDYVNQFDEPVVSDQWAVAGYVLDSPVYSPWTDFETLREDYGVRYGVMSGEQPYEVLKSYSNDCVTYHVYDLTEPV